VGELRQLKNTAAYDAYLRGRALEGGLDGGLLKYRGAARSYQDAVEFGSQLRPGMGVCLSSRMAAAFIGMELIPAPARLAAIRTR